MWRPCDTILDKPARVWMFLLEDVYVFLGLMTGLFLLMDILLALALAASVTYGLYRVKRGTPLGLVWHRLHRWQFLRLPGVLSPRPTTYSVW